MKIPIRAWLPFLGWFPVSSAQVRADLLAGVTVALVLIPQSMAYAQLAGLPSYYGLYAAFLPVMVGALWGSSRQLSTGPVGHRPVPAPAHVAPGRHPQDPAAGTRLPLQGAGPEGPAGTARVSR